MKNDIIPLWENKENKNGGSWSYEVNKENVKDLWQDLSMYLVCEELLKYPNEVNGISLYLKKNNKYIIKIWNNNSSNNKLKMINENVLQKWGLDIIYMINNS
jgi:L-rhamnose mutarotase